MKINQTTLAFVVLLRGAYGERGDARDAIVGYGRTVVLWPNQMLLQTPQSQRGAIKFAVDRVVNNGGFPLKRGDEVVCYVVVRGEGNATEMSGLAERVEVLRFAKRQPDEVLTFLQGLDVTNVSSVQQEIVFRNHGP